MFFRIIVLLIISMNFSVGQVVNYLPTDEEGNIVFTDVIEVEGNSKDQLYLNSKEFFAEVFKSANDVIQMDDKDAGIIIGKGLSDILIKGGLGIPVTMKMFYTMKIESREGRYKYSIYNIVYESYGSAQVQEMTIFAEDMFDKENYYKNNGKERSINSSYKDVTMEKINSLKERLIDTMESNSISDQSDDW